MLGKILNFEIDWEICMCNWPRKPGPLTVPGPVSGYVLIHYNRLL